MKMKFHAIVPVKSLERAKSRLAATLNPAERRLLVLEMLRRVLCVLREPAAPVAVTWVISVDPTVRAMAMAQGARPLSENGVELNDALDQARAAALAAGAEALLVLPADVPLVRPSDLTGLAALLGQGADLALAPDGEGRGTNALAMRRGAELPFRFGPNSATLHLAAAAERGLVARRYLSSTLALDVDDPLSLARYRALAELHEPCGVLGT